MSQVSEAEVVQDQADLPTRVDNGGVLVVKGEPLDDLTDIVSRERERRIADLVRQYEGEQVVGMTILNTSLRPSTFTRMHQPETAGVGIASA